MTDPLYILETPRRITPQALKRIGRQLQSAGIGKCLILEEGMTMRRIPLDPEAMVMRWFGFQRVPA